MLRPFLLTLPFLVFPLATAEAQKAKAFEPFDFTTSDTFGRYTMMDLKRVNKDHVETLVRRMSTKSGEVVFTKRLIDCRGAMQFKTLASANTLEALSSSKPDTKWSPLVQGSSAHATAVNGCSRTP